MGRPVRTFYGDHTDGHLPERLPAEALPPEPGPDAPDWPADGTFDDLVGSRQAQIAASAACLGWLRGDSAPIRGS